MKTKQNKTSEDIVQENEVKEYHITLLQEEVESLLNMEEICVFQDDSRNMKLYIQLPQNKENMLKQDILQRYDNEEYWDSDLQQDEESWEEATQKEIE